MLRFFRQIRQRLLIDNKFSKYLLYAVGEILLVVIGILIALQINTYNQNKLDRSYEVKMLTEIRNALVADKLYFEEMEEVLYNLRTTSEFFMDLSKNDQNFNDSLLPKIFDLNENISYQYNAGPYEALKSSGMDKVSNDSIRILLSDLYDFEFPRLEKSILQITINHKNNIDSMLVLLGDRYIHDSRGYNSVGWKNVPIDLFQRQGFLQILAGVNFRGRQAGRRIKLFIPTIEKAIVQLNSEIDK